MPFVPLFENNPRSPLYDDVLYDLGNNNLLTNNNNQAIEWYNKLIKERPRSAFAQKALLRTAQVYYETNQNNKAISKFKQIIKDYPASEEAGIALTTLEQIYVEENKIDDYVKFAEDLEYVQISPTVQDSLTFTAAENFYAQGNCEQTIDAMAKYLEKFPKGAYVLKANYYRADCLLKANRMDEALGNLKFIIDYPDNPYSLLALERIAPVSYNNGNYENALNEYQRMEMLANNKDQIVKSIEGQMECYYKLSKYKEASDFAKKLLKTEKINHDQMVKAHLIQAKAEYELGNLKNARREFKITSGLTSGELAPESLYYTALIDYKQKKYTEAENTVFSLVENYSSYDYWVGKAFILLSDVYISMDNLFQAKQTLQSIVDNYPKEDLKKVAREKLHSIEMMEANKEQEKQDNTPEEEPIIVR